MENLCMSSMVFVRDGSVEFQQLNPSDIESVSVLKDDFRCSICMNASNGVIVVTTKRGESHRPQFTYSGNVGWQKVTDRPLMPMRPNIWKCTMMRFFIETGCIVLPMKN